MSDLIERLIIDAACLRKMVDHAKLAGPETDVRVKSPGLLLDSLSGAADRITALEKENAELRAALEPFTQIVAARKSYVDATAVYNTRLELAREERGRGNWEMKLDREYAAMSEAQSAWHRTAQELADAALFKWAAIPRKPSEAEGREATNDSP